MAARHYSSFLLRYWQSGQQGKQTRIKLEHIQSGEVVRVKTVAEALAWLEERANGPPAVVDSQEDSERIEPDFVRTVESRS